MHAVFRLILLLLIPTVVFADAAIFSGSTVKLLKPMNSGSATSGQVLTANGSGSSSWTTIQPSARVVCTGDAGKASSNTAIRTFTSCSTTGSNITYASSATNGDTFTINTTGIYAISYNFNLPADNYCGVSVNSNQLTTSILTITAAHYRGAAHVGGSDQVAEFAYVGAFTATDVVRAHCENNLANTGSFTARMFFHIVRLL